MRKSITFKETVSKDGKIEDVSVNDFKPKPESHDSSLFDETSKHKIKRPSEHVKEISAKTQEHDDTYPTAMQDKIFSSEWLSERLVSDGKRADAPSNHNKQVELDHQTGKVIIDEDKPMSFADGASKNIQTITKQGTITKLKNFFGVDKKVNKVKVSITKEKFLQMSCRVGEKQLHNKKIAPVIIWDFGGQDVFYSTHQTFLTYRAVYIIVLDGSRKLDEVCPFAQYLPGKSGHKTARDYLRFWINTIVTYCKGCIPDFPKIIVVLTHKDQVEASEVEYRRHELFEDISQMFEQTPLKQHLVIDDKIFVNAKDKHDPEMVKITRVIIRESEQQPTWGESLPKCFIPLELEFAYLIKRNVPLITVEHLQKINATQAIRPLSETELKVFLKFQHSIGKVLYFDEHKLDNHVLLSPTHLIDAFKSIVTDRRFCEGDNDREELWDVMGKKGVVPKKVIQTIWKKKKYCEFYKNQDYLLGVMTHLDILVEPKRYDSNHSRIPADFYYIASMVRTTDDSGYLLSPDFKNRSIALAFQSSSLMIPPALSFRFISYCLNIWAVKTNEQTKQDMLFHRSVVFIIDASLDLHILCEDDMIVVRLVHSTSNTMIIRDMASSINECVTSALEKISQLYIKTSSDQNQTSSHQNQTSSLQNQTNSHQNQTSSHQNHTSSHQNQTSSHRNQTTSHQNQTSSHQNQTISHQNQTSSHHNDPSSHQNQTSSHQNQTSSRQNQTSSHQNQTSSHHNQNSSLQNQTNIASFITSVCCNSPDKPCILEVNKLGLMETWICPSHCITHRIHTIAAWIKEKKPTDLHLRRLSLLYNKKDVEELAIFIGLSTAQVENILEADDTMQKKFEVLRQCRDILAVTFNNIKDAMEAGGNKSVHTLCQIFKHDKGDPIDFEHEPEKWDRVLTEKHIDRLAPLIGNNSLPFLIELDMAFQTWEQISHRQNKRDLVGLNTDILAEWRTKFCQTNGPKPTLRAIALAFHNIGKNRKFIEEVLFPHGSDIHNQ
ncbi:Hypothetical predicted protein [Mytilus galloprovincialis]|uniref:C-terminal of Roc (COR) domain-containing protein n=1 Tax=Mytilus galloprovincialis TaxID=29158 RepID=A0A8B6G3G0_MYTGA|nr:Hypothetical predicted protein [Mytilus galloprovincialis]